MGKSQNQTGIYEPLNPFTLYKYLDMYRTKSATNIVIIPSLYLWHIQKKNWARVYIL